MEMKPQYEAPNIRLSDELGYLVRNQLCGQSATGFYEGGAGTYGDGTINDYNGSEIFE